MQSDQNIVKGTDGPKWEEGNRISLHLSEPPDTSTLTFEISDNGDFWVRFGEGEGELILVAGHVMLTRGIEAPAGMEGDVLDGSALTLQLALRLLERAFPQGPSSVGENERIELVEKERGIRLAVAGASGGIPPPWRLIGTAAQALGAVQFELRLTTGDTADENVTHIAGTWMKDPAPPVIDDELNIEGWMVYGMGVREQRMEGGTSVDFGATPREAAHTIGDIRRQVAEEGQGDDE